MASYTLLMLGRQYLIDPTAFRNVYTNPWLLWEPPAASQQGEILHTDVYEDRLASGAPLESGGVTTAIEVVKKDQPNGFPFGITLGHSENNDVVLRHHLVSRFHAYFQRSKEQLLLVDADSKNGTSLDGKRLQARVPEPLPARASLRFGELEVRYFAPEQMIAFIEEKASA